ncbi:sodium/solute symporter [Lentisphaerota bacterium ZTH]|nr:sodium/solute symporter [Lentisphaerota bacterium]WET06597.1 sodium/solute symporter [Lentisphaerota bacterium ZTH]
MRTIDLWVFYGYLVLILGIGLWLRGRKKSENEFFLADSNMGWFPLGISIMVTMLTAVNYAIFPTEIFSRGIYVTVAIPVFVLVAWPVTRFFIPFYRRQKCTSAYEFLEQRFDLKTRCLASGLFIMWRILWMTVALYASSRILSAITGYSLWIIILFSGLITVAYTAVGGIRAVIWTDVAQFFVLFGGIILGLIIADIRTPGGVDEIFSVAFRGGLFKPVTPYDPNFFSFDPTIRVTFWSGTTGTVVAFLVRYGADQMVVQRFLTAKSERDACKSFWLNVVCTVIVLVLLVIFGMAIYSFAVHSRVLGRFELPLAYLKFLIKSMPYGGCGLMAAGLLAATMSSVDSGINACSAAWTRDFYHRLISERVRSSELHIRFSTLFTIIVGTVIIIMALLFIVLFGRHHNIFVLANKIINGMGSPLLAVVAAGMLKRRFTPDGVFWGGVCGTVCSVITVLVISNLALHYYAVVNLGLTFSFISILSMLLRKASTGQSSLPPKTPDLSR